MPQNKFMVGLQGENVVIGNPPRGPITRREAMYLAAHLLTMAEAGLEGHYSSEWEDILNLVQE